MQTVTVGEYIRHNSGARGKVTSLSPDGTIADVYNLATGRADTWPLCVCTPDNEDGTLANHTHPTVSQPVRVAMGPIIGAILISNLICDAVGFVVLLLAGVIH